MILLLRFSLSLSFFRPPLRCFAAVSSPPADTLRRAMLLRVVLPRVIAAYALLRHSFYARERGVRRRFRGLLLMLCDIAIFFARWMLAITTRDAMIALAPRRTSHFAEMAEDAAMRLLPPLLFMMLFFADADAPCLFFCCALMLRC